MSDRPGAVARMEAFDRLPVAVQRALAGSPCDFNPLSVLNMVEFEGEMATLDMIRRSEAKRSRESGGSNVR